MQSNLKKKIECIIFKVFIFQTYFKFKATKTNFLSNNSNKDTRTKCISPIKSYNNALELKKLIIDENKHKSGVYLWRNNVNNLIYVGSAVNLAVRLARYYHKSELNKGVKPRPIHAALLKYGHSNFTLEILEYCSKDSLMVRENYYFRLLTPEYNILKYAYNLKGYKHSTETIAKLKTKVVSDEHKLLLSVIHKNKIVSEETRKKLSVATTNYKKNNPISQEKLERLRYLGIKYSGVPVLVTNSNTGKVIEFTNQTEAGKFLNVTRQAIHNALIRKTPIKNVFYISKK